MVAGMEKLAAWIKDHGMNQKAFAAHSGVSEGNLSRLLGGTITPGLEMAFRIQRATNGEVRPEDWLKSEAA